MASARSGMDVSLNVCSRPPIKDLWGRVPSGACADRTPPPISSAATHNAATHLEAPTEEPDRSSAPTISYA